MGMYLNDAKCSFWNRLNREIYCSRGISVIALMDLFLFFNTQLHKLFLSLIAIRKIRKKFSENFLSLLIIMN